MNTSRLVLGALLSVAAVRLAAHERAWSANAIEECDRACLVGVAGSGKMRKAQSSKQ